MKPVFTHLSTLGLTWFLLAACLSGAAATPLAATAAQPTPTLFLPTVERGAGTARLQPDDLEYLGAFRLPDGGERPLTFDYGGAALTYRPDGDPAGGADGFGGSLFLMGHDRLPYGELPDGNQVAEISIPPPLVRADAAGLNQAAFVQPFHDVAAGHFSGLDELPRAALLYLDHPLSGPLVHLAWGAHFQEQDTPSHAWFRPDLSAPGFQGEWRLGSQPPYQVNGYLFEIDPAWAATYGGGRLIASGRFRDGGWAGMGPNIYAYTPWDAAGNPPAPGTRLQEITLLHYTTSQETGEIERAMQAYQHPDEWEGAAWLTAPGGRAAVIFAGTKGVGAKYWYGYINPAGPQYPCVSDEAAREFTACRLASGQPCPPEEMIECQGHSSARGWWASQAQAQIIFYDPADLARVAAGQIQPWEPQPYAALSLDEQLFFNPPAWDEVYLGQGAQRRYRIGEIAYDRAGNRLYVLELYGDGPRPVVHVWQVR